MSECECQSAALLKSILESPELVVFLGAGASWDSGLPMGDSAAEALVDICFSVGGVANLKPGNIVSDKGGWPRFEVVLDILSRFLPAAPSDIVESFLNIGMSSTHNSLWRNCP